jgi:hypothetical protein
MRSNYNDEEQRALIELSKLLANEVGRASRIMNAAIKHLPGCESAEHREAVAKQATEAAKNLLNTLRYAAWIEAEMSDIRLFEKPQENLKQIEDMLTDLAIKYAPKYPAAEQPADVETLGPTLVDVTPEEALPPVVIEIVPPEEMIQRVQEIEMDKLANSPFTITKQ